MDFILFFFQFVVGLLENRELRRKKKWHNCSVQILDKIKVHTIYYFMFHHHIALNIRWITNQANFFILCLSLFFDFLCFERKNKFKLYNRQQLFWFFTFWIICVCHVLVCRNYTCIFSFVLNLHFVWLGTKKQEKKRAK